MRFKISSTGMYAPPDVETAADLAPRIGVTAEWIESQTGVPRRHVAREPLEQMAAKAARAALGDGPPPDLVINASTTPRQLIPDSSVFLAGELGLDGVPSFTLHATCLSFVVALHAAGAYLATGAYRRVLVVSAEIASGSRNYAEPESASLLGDGAGAVVVEPAGPGEESGLLAYEMGTWPRFSNLAELRGAGTRLHPNDPATRPVDNTFTMDGPAIYKAARRRVAVVLRALLDKSGLELSDLDLIVPHQPSGPALAALARYGCPPERTVNIVAEYGNCIAASIPMALAVADAEGRIRRGDRVLLIGTGAGLSVAGAVLRW